MRLLALGSIATCALLALPALPAVPLVAPAAPQVLPPTAFFQGLSYAEWSAGWWQWYMQHSIVGHPGIDDTQFDVTSGQSGKVWYLATLLDFGPAVPHTRTIDLPVGKSLFIGLMNAEMSSQEGVVCEEDQRAIANFVADRVGALNLSIDGQDVENIADYRFESKQFTFTAPDPWIFGPTGAGELGTAVADGYYALLAPMSVGQHVIHITGGFFFEAGVFGPDPVEFNADMTYVVNVY